MSLWGKSKLSLFRKMQYVDGEEKRLLDGPGSRHKNWCITLHSEGQALISACQPHVEEENNSVVSPYLQCCFLQFQIPTVTMVCKWVLKFPSHPHLLLLTVQPSIPSCLDDLGSPVAGDLPSDELAINSSLTLGHNGNIIHLSSPHYLDIVT